MANLDLYIDTTACQAVQGFANSSPVAPPLFVQGNTLNMRIWLMARASTFPATPYVYVANTDVTLQVAIGKRDGSGLLYTQQFTWTPNSDLANPYFSAQLPLNTAGIGTLLGSATSAQAWLEVQYIVGGVPTTILLQQITIQASVITNSSLIVPAGQTPLSAEAAAAIFLQHVVTGPITLKNGTGQAVSIYVGADGTFHTDPIS